VGVYIYIHPFFKKEERKGRKMEDIPRYVKSEITDARILESGDSYITELYKMATNSTIKKYLSFILKGGPSNEYFVEFLMSSYIVGRRFAESVVFKRYLDNCNVNLSGRFLTNQLIYAYYPKISEVFVSLLKSWGAIFTVDSIRTLLCYNIVAEDFYTFNLSAIQIKDSLGRSIDANKNRDEVLLLNPVTSDDEISILPDEKNDTTTVIKYHVQPFSSIPTSLVTRKNLNSIKFLYGKISLSYPKELDGFIDILTNHILISESLDVLENILHYQPTKLVMKWLIDNMIKLGGIKKDITLGFIKGTMQTEMFLFLVGYKGYNDLAIRYSYQIPLMAHVIVIGSIIGNKLDISKTILEANIINTNLTDILIIAIKYDKTQIAAIIKKQIPDVSDIWNILYSLSNSRKMTSMILQWKSDGTSRMSSYLKFLISGSAGDKFLRNIRFYEQLL